MLGGFLLYLKGPARSLNFEDDYLGSWTQSLATKDCKEIVWYGPGDFNAYSENFTILTSTSISKGEIYLHVLNESQFNIWNTNGTINQSIISQNITNTQTIGFKPPQEGVKFYPTHTRLSTRFCEL
jgi:hypothetical protein